MQVPSLASLARGKAGGGGKRLFGVMTLARYYIYWSQCHVHAQGDLSSCRLDNFALLLSDIHRTVEYLSPGGRETTRTLWHF